jgi:hypothetical protein
MFAEQERRNGYAILLNLVDTSIKIGLMIPIALFTYRNFQENHNYKQAGKILGIWFLISGITNLVINKLEYKINNFIAESPKIINWLAHVPLFGNSMQKFYRERKEIIDYYKKPKYQVVDLTDDSKSPYEMKTGLKVVSYKTAKKEEATKPKEIIKVKMTQEEYDAKVREIENKWIKDRIDYLKKDRSDLLKDFKETVEITASPIDNQAPQAEIIIPEYEIQQLESNITKIKQVVEELPEKQKEIIKQDVNILEETTKKMGMHPTLTEADLFPEKTPHDEQKDSARDREDAKKEKKHKSKGWIFGK